MRCVLIMHISALTRTELSDLLLSSKFFRHHMARITFQPRLFDCAHASSFVRQFLLSQTTDVQHELFASMTKLSHHAFVEDSAPDMAVIWPFRSQVARGDVSYP